MEIATAGKRNDSRKGGVLKPAVQCFFQVLKSPMAGRPLAAPSAGFNE
jgi:hypothetical protein